jgi:hypothetical protein
VRGAATGLVDDERAVVGSRTWFAGHGWNNPPGGGTPPNFFASVDSK